MKDRILAARKIWPSEHWRIVQGYTDYAVSDHGHVVSWRANSQRAIRPHRLSPFVALHDGYRYVTLCNDKGHRQFQVHVLVLVAFVGPCPKGMQTRHLDGNSGNNRSSNLVWGTSSDNAKDRVRHGTAHVFKPGRAHPHSTSVSRSEIKEILRRHKQQETLREIARAVGHSKAIVWAIVRGTHWSVRKKDDGCRSKIR